MYKKIFDQEVQKEMDSFFINDLSHYGKVEAVKKRSGYKPKKFR